MRAPLLPLTLLLLVFGSCEGPDSKPGKDFLPTAQDADIAHSYTEIGKAYIREKKFHEADSVYRQALQIAERLKDKTLEGKCLNNLALVNFSTKQFEKGLDFGFRAIAVYEEMGNDTLLGQTYHNLGRAYKDAEVYSLAIENLKLAIPLLKKTVQYKNLGLTYFSTANISKFLRRYEEAEEYLQFSIELYKEIGDSVRLAKGYQNLGLVYIDQEKFEKAEDIFHKALHLKLQVGVTKGLAKTYASLGKVKLKRKNYHDGKRYLNISRLIREEEQNHPGVASSEIYLGELFLATGNIDSASHYLKLAQPLVQNFGSSKLKLQYQELSSRFHRYNQNWLATLLAMDTILALNNAIINEENIRTTDRAIVKLKILNATENLNQKIVQQEEKIQLHSKIENFQIAANALLILVAFLIFMLYRQKRSEKKSMENLLREFHHRSKNNFQALSEALQLELIKLKSPSNSEKDDFGVDHMGLIEREQSRIKAMALVHEQLYLAPSAQLGEVKLDQYLTQLVSNLDEIYGSLNNPVQFNFSMAPIFFNADKATRLGLVVNEAVTNCFKHGLNNTDEPSLEIFLSKPENLKMNNSKDSFALIIKDNGPGLPNSGEIERDSSMGFILMDEITRELGGNFKVAGENGTTISIEFSKNR